MSMNRKDWLKLLGLVAAGTAGAGMLGAGPLAGILGTAEAAGTVGAAGSAAAPELAGAGMFNMVPGVTSGSAQHLALLEQNAGLGGTAADLTAQAARSATGNAGFLDTIANTAKADLAGMNDPSVWIDRLGRNADRFAGNAGRNMAAGALAQQLMGGGQQPQRPAGPPPVPQGPTTPPPDMFAASNKAGGPDLDALALKLGMSRQDLEKMLAQMGAREMT